MINLSSLKIGQTKDIDGWEITKSEHGDYLITGHGKSASVRYVKASRAWVATYDTHDGEVTVQLDGVNAKTVVETLIAQWPVEEAPEAAEEKLSTYTVTYVLITDDGLVDFEVKTREVRATSPCGAIDSMVAFLSADSLINSVWDYMVMDASLGDDRFEWNTLDDLERRMDHLTNA